MRDRIWAELTQAKHNSEYSSLYLERQKKLKQYSQLIILAFSTGGIMGWPFWDKLPMIACVIISAISLLRLIQPQLIMKDEDLAKLDRINIFYCGYFVKLEKMWYEFEEMANYDSSFRNNFFELVNSESDANKLLNEIVLFHNKKLIKKAKTNSDTYFANVFHTTNS
ncbi:MAG: hypothetical protein AB2L24_18505 [Mangrovibacterium sp.]